VSFEWISTPPGVRSTQHHTRRSRAIARRRGPLAAGPAWRPGVPPSSSSRLRRRLDDEPPLSFGHVSFRGVDSPMPTAAMAAPSSDDLPLLRTDERGCSGLSPVRSDICSPIRGTPKGQVARPPGAPPAAASGPRGSPAALAAALFFLRPPMRSAAGPPPHPRFRRPPSSWRPRLLMSPLPVAPLIPEVLPSPHRPCSTRMRRGWRPGRRSRPRSASDSDSNPRKACALFWRARGEGPTEVP
jgi:hypothetical protein